MTFITTRSEERKLRKLRLDFWWHFEKYKDKVGNDWAKCNLCKKNFDGSSRSGTTHLRNHFKSCQKKTSGGGGGGAGAGAVLFDDHDSCRTNIRDVDKYWREYNFVLAIAAVLDPQFKMDIVKRWYKKIYGDKCEEYLTIFKNYFINIYNEYIKGTDNFKSCTLGSQETNSSISYKMLDLLRKRFKFPLIENFYILIWWRENTQYFPTLVKMSRDFLSIQISTSFVDVLENNNLVDCKHFDFDMVK
ncbi:hypothetical protein ACOSQ3_022302 [Xanthoceras sorbifolium]